MGLVGLDEVRAAADRLRPLLRTTPLESSRSVSELAGAEVALKCENLQRTGSFKPRGAINRIAQLSDAERRAGVVCASAGNHAQGVALASQLLGVHATVVMPREAPLPKVAATTAYGAEVDLVGDSFEAAMTHARQLARRTGRVFIPPFEHPHIIAGQGTVALELLEQRPDVGTVVVCVGGGGLISGMAVVLRALAPHVRIVGVQAAGCATFPGSLAAGAPRGIDRAATIADGIAVEQPGALTYAHVAALVDEVVTVTDDELARAVVLLLERAKLVVEPSGAAAVAALLAGRVEPVPGAPVVATLSGGNIDPLLLTHLVTSGLTAQGRYTTVRTQVSDAPGGLSALLACVAGQRANVVGVGHHRLDPRLALGQVGVVLELETRGPGHVSALRAALRDAGYPLDDDPPVDHAPRAS